MLLPRRSALAALLAGLVVLASPASAQGHSGRPGGGYVARALTGGVPVGAVRGVYPGADGPVLFVVNHPTPDSTAFSAFVGGRIVRRFAIGVGSRLARFLDADISAPVEVSADVLADRPVDGDLATTMVYAVFEFDTDAAAFHVLWDLEADRWVLVARYKADGALAVDGDLSWFGEEAARTRYPRGGPEGGLPERALDRDTRQIAMSGATSIRAERSVYEGVFDVYYRLAVYDGDVGPVQTMDGVTSVSFPDLAEDGVQTCTGLPAVTDVNGDGHADFWLCDSQAANGYQDGTYRVYDPSAGLFVKDLAFSFSGYHTFDPDTRTVQEGQWATAGAYQTHRTYDLSSGTPVLVREERREPERDECAGGPTCRGRFTTRVLDGGEMRMTETRLGRPDEYLPAGFGMAPGGHE